MSTPALPRGASPASRGARPAPPVTVVEVPAAAVLPLRLEVLRDGTPSDDPAFDGDDEPTTVHLAAVADERIVAVSTWMRRPWPFTPERQAVQLRGLATDATLRGRGIAGVLVEAGVARAFADGAAIVWANARDSALRFYHAHGFDVEGEGFRTEETALPHHRVIRRAASDAGTPAAGITIPR